MSKYLKLSTRGPKVLAVPGPANIMVSAGAPVVVNSHCINESLARKLPGLIIEPFFLPGSEPINPLVPATGPISEPAPEPAPEVAASAPAAFIPPVASTEPESEDTLPDDQASAIDKPKRKPRKKG